LNSMWPFPLSSFKSSPMLSMLLSVEELESLVIPYCHMFENCLHFLAFVNSVVLQLLLIIIKSWFQSFIISSSPTSIPSLLLPHLPQFFSYLQNRTCTETPFQIEVYEIIFPMSHRTHETGSEQESCVYFTPAIQYVQGWFQTATLNVFTISPCTGLQNWWFLMRWKEGLKKLLNIKFSSIVHLWTCTQILMETATSLSSFADD
jgi:hypothetical protein